MPDDPGLDPVLVDTASAALIEALDASPTPYHACATAASLLTAAGYAEVDEAAPFPTAPGRYVLVRGGSLVAWDSRGGTGSFRIVGAHTDSPNLRIKPRPDVARAGWQLLGVEPYGGPLLNSWLDRDLGLAGRVCLRDGRGVRTELVNITEPILRVPQLAIHLDRQVNESGLRLDPQQHLSPVWGVGDRPADLRGYLADRLGAHAGDLLSYDLMTVELTGARRIGRDADLLASGRLDNLGTAFAAVHALTGGDADGSDETRLIVLFDHEEVGSESASGARSPLLMTVLERILGGDRERLWRALARTVIASGDMAHATHPNYAELHEPQHRIAINGGPVLKINNKLRYATDAPGAAHFLLAGAQAGVPVQQFVVRSDMPCGSTVGPMTAALTGAVTVDFGQAMLSMHSARELTGALDVPRYVACLRAFLAPRP